jgi:hypothetical protein
MCTELVPTAEAARGRNIGTEISTDFTRVVHTGTPMALADADID